MDTYESLLRLCDGSDPFSKRGPLFCAFDAGEMLIPNALLPSFIMRDFFLLFLSFIAKVTDIPSKLPIISENFFLPSKIRQKSKRVYPLMRVHPF